MVIGKMVILFICARPKIEIVYSVESVWVKHFRCRFLFSYSLLAVFYSQKRIYFAPWETNISERLHCLFLSFDKKVHFFLVYQFNSLLLPYPRGEILGSRKRFLLYPMLRNRQILVEGWGQCNAHSVCIHRVQPTLYLTRYIRQRGVFVSQFISTMAFGDASNMMSATSLYAFLVYTNQAQNLLLISGDLQAR